MAVTIESDISKRFLRARQDVHLTQLELSEKAKISLRSIKDLESGRRTSFNEDTLIRLCRVLSLDCQEVLGEVKLEKKHGGKSKPWALRGMTVLTVAILALAVAFWVSMTQNSPRIRTDWVRADELLEAHPTTPKWTREGFHINYYRLKTVAQPGEIVPVELKWSYHFKPISFPIFYINAFGEWDPDREIPIAVDTFNGDGSKIYNFELSYPQKAGTYRVRVFFASSFGPMDSFYGHPLPNQLISPNTAPHLQFEIEVLPK